MRTPDALLHEIENNPELWRVYEEAMIVWLTNVQLEAHKEGWNQGVEEAARLTHSNLIRPEANVIQQAILNLRKPI